MFGELNLVGFKVSHTKDGIRWDEVEEEFITKLRAELSKADLPILDQANNYRSTESAKENRPAAQKALFQLEQEVPSEVIGAALEKVQEEIESTPSQDLEPQKTMRSKADDVAVSLELDLGGHFWEVALALDYKDPGADWIRISDQPTHAGSRPRRLGVRLAMLHPFSQRFFAGANQEQIQGLARLAIGLVLAETIARDGGVKLAGRVRTSLNELLRLGLSA